MRHRLAAALPAVLLALLAGCAQTPTAPALGLMDVLARPAERTLQGGFRAYDDAQYAEAEKLLVQALQAGLVSPRDRGAAFKTLAFIYCTTNRVAECEASFRAALKSDPSFALTKSEAGHPVWGPVYKRVVPQ